MLHSFPRVIACAALLTGVVALPALAQNDHAGRPGTINYVEGEDSLAYTYVPADGIFYSPFGWGFYSPPLVYNSPYYYDGFPERDEHHEHRFEDLHRPYGHGFEPRGGFEGRAGGFHGRGHR